LGNIIRNDYLNDLDYTQAVIKHVRRIHQIDDRMENARKESISKNYVTNTVWPSSLSHSFNQIDNNT